MNRYDIYTLLKLVRDGGIANQVVKKETKTFLKEINLNSISSVENMDTEELKEGLIEFLTVIGLDE